MLSVKSSRKASLDLSVNSIVVMVIAFVVLGLILTFTRGIFSFGQGQLSQIQNVVDLAEKPDSGNPIVPRSMNLETIAGQKISMGFYNTGSTSLNSVELEFKDCIGTKSDGGSFTGSSATIPVLSMIKTGAVGASKSVGITALINNKDKLPKGDYVCSVQTKGSTPNPAISVQVSVKVG